MESYVQHLFQIVVGVSPDIIPESGRAILSVEFLARSTGDRTGLGMTSWSDLSQCRIARNSFSGKGRRRFGFGSGQGRCALMDGQTQGKLEIALIKSTSCDPSNKTTLETKLNQSAAGESRKFEVCCNAGSARHLEVASDSVSVRIGQRIGGDRKDGLWGSLLV